MSDMRATVSSVLRAVHPGCVFRITGPDQALTVMWEDGPTNEQVVGVLAELDGAWAVDYGLREMTAVGAMHIARRLRELVGDVTGDDVINSWWTNEIDNRKLDDPVTDLLAQAAMPLSGIVGSGDGVRVDARSPITDSSVEQLYADAISYVVNIAGADTVATLEIWVALLVDRLVDTDRHLYAPELLAAARALSR